MIELDLVYIALADPGGGGAHPARAPPNGRGPMIFLCPKRFFFSIFPRSLRSRIILNLILIEMWPEKVPKHAKNDFYCYTSTFNTFNDFLPPPQKSTPPLRSNPGSATESDLLDSFAHFIDSEIVVRFEKAFEMACLNTALKYHIM